MQTTSPHLRSVVDEDGAIILDIEHDSMITLNPTGAYIWQRLQQGKLAHEIVRELAHDTGADVSMVDRDVHIFLEQLKSKHLMRDAEPERKQCMFRHTGIR